MSYKQLVGACKRRRGERVQPCVSQSPVPGYEGAPSVPSPDRPRIEDRRLSHRGAVAVNTPAGDLNCSCKGGSEGTGAQARRRGPAAGPEYPPSTFHMYVYCLLDIHHFRHVFIHLSRSPPELPRPCCRQALPGYTLLAQQCRGHQRHWINSNTEPEGLQCVALWSFRWPLRSQKMSVVGCSQRRFKPLASVT